MFSFVDSRTVLLLVASQVCLLALVRCQEDDRKWQLLLLPLSVWTLMPCSQTFLILICQSQNYVHAKEKKRSCFGAVVTFFARIIRENIENPSFAFLFGFFKENVKVEVLSRSTKKVVCGFICTSRYDATRAEVSTCVKVMKSLEMCGDFKGEKRRVWWTFLFFFCPCCIIINYITVF